MQDEDTPARPELPSRKAANEAVKASEEAKAAHAAFAVPRDMDLAEQMKVS